MEMVPKRQSVFKSFQFWRHPRHRAINPNRSKGEVLLLEMPPPHPLIILAKEFSPLLVSHIKHQQQFKYHYTILHSVTIHRHTHTHIPISGSTNQQMSCLPYVVTYGMQDICFRDNCWHNIYTCSRIYQFWQVFWHFKEMNNSHSE